MPLYDLLGKWQGGPNNNRIIIERECRSFTGSRRTWTTGAPPKGRNAEAALGTLGSVVSAANFGHFHGGLIAQPMFITFFDILLPIQVACLQCVSLFDRFTCAVQV
jgi:hypothetical protein